MKACQVIILALQILNMFLLLHRDIHGREAKEPLGFRGVVGTLIATALAFIVYFYAGAFSTLIKP